MVDVTRPKMHIWGENKVQKVIFTDEASMYFAKGWRDHPAKVGKPLEVEAVEVVTSKPKDDQPSESRVKRAYNKRG